MEHIAVVEGFKVYTLPTYATPYYYIRELGSVNHTMTLRALRTLIRRKLRTGKLRSPEAE